jgi:NTE family protein
MDLIKTPIENFVFEGGGVKGAVYAGCMQVMDEHGLFDQVKRVAGTSAGSITAALLAVGAGSKGLTTTILDSNFNKFIYHRGGILSDIFRTFWCYGIHSGNSFVAILKGYFQQFGGDADMTFGQLAEHIARDPTRFKDLYVVASDISNQLPKVFSSVHTPEIPIWMAVRASMSIPMLFEPFKIGKDYYVDGGLSWNYPIDIFDTMKDDGSRTYNQATLGFFLEPQSLVKDGPDFNPPRMQINSLKQALEAIIAFASDTSNADRIHPDDASRTVFVDNLGVSAIDFRISKTKIKELIASGRKATTAFLLDNGLGGA